jgi:hypothetical protein
MLLRSYVTNRRRVTPSGREVSIEAVLPDEPLWG